VADKLAMLLQPLRYAGVVQVIEAAIPFNAQLNTRDARQGVQWLHPVKHLTSTLCSIMFSLIMIVISIIGQFQL
jgi:hypothetical protein